MKIKNNRVFFLVVLFLINTTITKVLGQDDLIVFLKSHDSIPVWETQWSNEFDKNWNFIGAYTMYQGLSFTLNDSVYDFLYPTEFVGAINKESCDSLVIDGNIKYCYDFQNHTIIQFAREFFPTEELLNIVLKKKIRKGISEKRIYDWIFTEPRKHR